MARKPLVIVTSCQRMIGHHPHHIAGRKYVDAVRLAGALPLIAIGGLDVERGKACLAAGADMVSVVTDITLNADPEARTREWVAATRP